LNRLAAAKEYQSEGLPIALLLGPKHSLRLETTCRNRRERLLDALDIRAGDIVRAELSVEVELDTGVLSGVELGEVTTAESPGAATSDLEVDALGVGLGTVVLASGVKTDDLVSEDVVTGLEVLGDGELPGVTVRDELIGSPAAGVAARDKALLGDLGPSEASLVDAGEVAADGGEVLSDGTVVRFGPGVPLQGDNITSSDSDGVADGASALVADDIGSAEGVGLDEAVVLVSSSPANSVGGSTVGNTTSVLLATSDDLSDVAVGVDRAGEESHSGEGESVAVHFCGLRTGEACWASCSGMK
jgi:hypothetical protein